MEIIALAIIFGASLWLQMWLFGKHAFTGLEYRCEFSSREAHEGDSLYLVETIYNKKLLPVPWLKVDIHSSRWLDFAGTCSVVAQDSRRVTSSFILKGYQRVTRRWRLKCLKRGVFTTENVTLVSGDLLNFSVVSIPARVDASLTVYPEIIDLDEVFVPVNFLQSDHIVRRWIVDDPFIIAGTRGYTGSEPLNRIHWPATAKEGRLMVRKNDFTSQTGLTILLNMQSKLYEYTDVVYKDTAELGIKTAATLLDRALKSGAPVRMGSNGCIPEEPDRMIFTGEAVDREHVAGLLRILARLAMKTVKDFEVFLESRTGELENSDIIIITAYMSRRMCEQIRLLQDGSNNVGVVLLDRVFEEGALPGDIEIYAVAEKYLSKKAGGVAEHEGSG
jgi:hypothetical protein